MALKRMDAPEEVHTSVVEYMEDYGHRSIAAALTEIVSLAMLVSRDERLELRDRKRQRQARLAGHAAPAPARRRRGRPAAGAAQAVEPLATDDDTGQDPADDSGLAGDGVDARNGEYAHQ